MTFGQEVTITEFFDNIGKVEMLEPNGTLAERLSHGRLAMQRGSSPRCSANE